MNRSKMPDSITTDSVIVPQMSRRRFLRSSAVLAIGLTGLMAACAPAAPPAATSAPAKPAEAAKPTEPAKPAEAAKPAAPAAAAPAATQAAPAASKPGTTSGDSIPFFSTDTDPGPKAALVKVTADYKQESGIEVVPSVLATSTSRGEALVRAFAVGQEVGIFELEDYYREDWAKAGSLVPLDDLIKELGESNFVNGSIFRAADGHYYGLPIHINPALCLYRMDLMEKAKVKEPTNAAEVIAAAKELTSGNQYGTGPALGPSRAPGQWFFTVVNQFGGDYFDKQGKLTFDQPQVLDAIKAMVGMFAYAPPGVANWGYSDANNAYVAGNIAIGRASPQLLTVLADKAPQILEATKVVALDPFGGPLNGQIGWGRWTQLAIASNTKNVDGAKKFLKYFATDIRAENWIASATGRVSPFPAISEKVLNGGQNEFVQKHRDQVAPYFKAVPVAVTPDSNMGSVTDGKFAKSSIIMPWAAGLWGGAPVDATMLQKIVVGKEPPEQAWQWAIGEMKRIADEWKAANPNWKPAA